MKRTALLKNLGKIWQPIPLWPKRILVAFCSLASVWLMCNLLFPLRLQVSYSPIVLDANGELLHAYLTPDEKWRMQVNADDISPAMRKAILSKEDRYFYYHPGINPIAVVRALFRNTLAGRRTSGASTITMQVAKMLHPKKRIWYNKLAEMFRATQLEMQLSKDEILQLYLSLASYGGNVEGIKSAAYFYLGKEPNHLSLAEIMALSVIPNQPAALRPGRHNDAIIKERNRWLVKMQKNGFFSATTIKDALNEPFDVIRKKTPQYAPHFAQLLKNKPSNTIYSSLQLQYQMQAEQLVAAYVAQLRYLNITNAATVIVNNATHEIVAYVGSANFLDSTAFGQVNGANAIRQPGSTLKPLVYALAIDKGMVTPKMVVADVPVNYQGYVPENYDQHFNGEVTMEYALLHSLNIPAVNMLQKVGKENMVATLNLCGFKQISKDQHKLGLSMILGGCGATLTELTGLFSAIANGGVYHNLRYYKDSSQTGIRIISKEAAFMVTDMLAKTDRPDFPLHWSSAENLPRVAWKTGTSYGRRDAWSIGYNKHFTIGTWVGNFSGQGIPELSGATIATPLLFRLFNAIDKIPYEDWYTPPETVQQRLVCAETGMPIAEFCSQKQLDYFIPLISSVKKCNNRQEIMVSANETISYCRNCMPVNGYKKKWYKLVAQEMAFFQINQPIWETIPPHNPMCEAIAAGKGPTIVSPQKGTAYLMSKNHPEPLLLECATANGVEKVYWYINKQLYKMAYAGQNIFFLPKEGSNQITCTDDRGRSTSLTIEVQWVNL